MRITEIFQAFPFLLAAITLTLRPADDLRPRWRPTGLIFLAKLLALLTFGHDREKPSTPSNCSVLTGMIAIIAFGWMTYARVIRGNILAVTRLWNTRWQPETIGASELRILFRHLMPNAVFPVLVIASMDIGSYVLSFAALSFLGLGAPTSGTRTGAR